MSRPGTDAENSPEYPHSDNRKIWYLPLAVATLDQTLIQYAIAVRLWEVIHVTLSSHSRSDMNELQLMLIKEHSESKP